jgi:hypothetical protein
MCSSVNLIAADVELIDDSIVTCLSFPLGDPNTFYCFYLRHLQLELLALPAAWDRHSTAFCTQKNQCTYAQLSIYGTPAQRSLHEALLMWQCG